MKRIKRIKHRVAALSMSFFLALGLIAPAFTIRTDAEALEVANATCTVADMIFSYCASGGVAIMNETVIDEVYNTLGSSFGNLQTFVNNGLLTYSNGQYVDTGLSTNINSAISNISSLDIGSLFSQTAAQNPTGVALTGAGSLAGIAGSVATTGVLPITAGVAVTGYCGFQIGTLIANFLGLYDEDVGLGIPITSPEVLKNYLIPGYAVINTKRIYSGSIYETYLSGDGIPFGYPNNNRLYAGILNNSNNAVSFRTISIKNNEITGTYDESVNAKTNKSISVRTDQSGEVHTINYFYSYDEYLRNYNNWVSGVSEPERKNNLSPDIIGNSGNQYGVYDNQNSKYNFPNVTPQFDPNNESINPAGLSKDDWLNYANNTSSNNASGNYDLNNDIFSDILDAIRINTPTPSPDPDPDPDPLPVPDPETVPLPDVNPYPDTYPVADPETVPDNRPQPEYTEKATENETDIVEGDPYTTPDLLNKFPFCIPRDILKIFKKLDSGARQAPHIQWRFNPNSMIDYTFNIDFSTWNDIASLLRLLELMGFIIALGVATRNLILS